MIHARSIGSNATLQGGITIGQKDNAGFPKIGDGVTLAAGCCILGNITLGDKALAGANAAVVHDVPAGTAKVGVLARQIGLSQTIEYRARPECSSNAIVILEAESR